MFASLMPRSLWPSVAAMAAIVLASNILVQYPFMHFGLGDILTWGAFSYPFAFLVTDLTNRWFGPVQTRKVVYVGFAVAVVLSLVFADAQIAMASGAAFLTAQLLDITVFNQLRARSWWQAPLMASTIGSVVDTAVFFTLAFGVTAAGSDLPWMTWALGDFAVKMLVAVLSLVPYARLMSVVKPYALAR